MSAPEQIRDDVKLAGLRGRGGAGFSCGLKWSFVDRRSGKPIYLICNADESEPGTFKDRQIIHKDPHQMIEGMIISCYANDVKLAYIYIRGEFPEGARILVHFGNGVFEHVPVAPEELETLVDDERLSLGHEKFRHRGGCRIQLLSEKLLGAVVEEGLGDGRPRLALRQLEFSVLLVEQRAAKRLALFGIVGGQLQGGFDHADRLPGNHEAFLGQLFHEHAEALPLDPTDEVFGRYADIGEKQLGRVAAFLPELLEQPPALEA